MRLVSNNFRMYISYSMIKDNHTLLIYMKLALNLFGLTGNHEQRPQNERCLRPYDFKLNCWILSVLRCND